MLRIASRAFVSDMQYHVLQEDIAPPTPLELFDYQVETLRQKDQLLPMKDVDRLRLLIPKEEQLFLVIPQLPKPFELEELMSRVQIFGRPGYNNVDKRFLQDVIPRLEIAHLLIDVEDGRQFLGRDENANFLSEILEDGRIPYTTWYGIIHAMLFPCVLQNHSLDLVGSHAEQKHETPYIYIASNACAQLDVRDSNELDFSRIGPPSAGGILRA